jgi:tetratricopeptide (TPR) repeat protein
MQPDEATIQAERKKVDPAAYELYMRGLIHQQNFTPQDFDRALQYYEAALEIAPDYTEAYTGIALIWGSRTVLGLVPPLEAGPKWKEYAKRAVELDPNLAEAHGALAQDLTWFEFEWEHAEVEFKRAIELNPYEPQARIFYSHFLAMMRRNEESDIQVRRALEIDPFNPFTQLLHGIQRGLTGRFDEALTLLGKMPPNPLASYQLAWDNIILGRMEEGAQQYAQYLAMLGDAQVAAVLEKPGDPAGAFGEAAEILAERARTMFVKPIVITFLYAWAGDFDNAFEWLERAYELKDHDLAYLAALPPSTAFAADPRCKAMLRRMNLPVQA